MLALGSYPWKSCKKGATNISEWIRYKIKFCGSIQPKYTMSGFEWPDQRGMEALIFSHAFSAIDDPSFADHFSTHKRYHPKRNQPGGRTVSSW